VQETVEQNNDLPVNLHFIIEGEEEIGSGNLGNFPPSKTARALACDIVMVSDNRHDRTQTLPNPQLWITRSDRAGVEGHRPQDRSSLQEFTVAQSLIPGYSPRSITWRRCMMIRAVFAIPGLLRCRRAAAGVGTAKAWRKVPVNADAEVLKENRRGPALFGEAGILAHWERLWARPTAEINGLGAGYQGPGTKTVISTRSDG